MAIEIFLLSKTGEVAYEASPNPAFVKKCQAPGDLYIKDIPLSPGRTVFKCPVIQKEVNLSQDVCYGPTDLTGCIFNRLT